MKIISKLGENERYSETIIGWKYRRSKGQNKQWICHISFSLKIVVFKFSFRNFKPFIRFVIYFPLSKTFINE